MKFVNFARYTKDQRVIDSVRPAHRVYVKGLMAEGRLIAGSPFVDDSGCLLIYEAESLESVEQMVANDPYSEGGVFVSCEIKPWECLGSNKDLLPGVFV